MAGLYGRILKEMGWLSKGDIVVRIPADFLGDVIGASERKTLEILAAARGKVCVPPHTHTPPAAAHLACGAAHERGCARPTRVMLLAYTSSRLSLRCAGACH